MAEEKGSVEQFGYKQELHRTLSLWDLTVYGLLPGVKSSSLWTLSAHNTACLISGLFQRARSCQRDQKTNSFAAVPLTGRQDTKKGQR